MTYPDSVRFLYSLGNEIKTAKFGLERIRTLLSALGHPEKDCRFIHVAGTNGKGSTCAMIDAGLRTAGVRTGLFTSPHLVEPTERIQIDGRPVSAEAFATAFETVHEASGRLLEAGAIDFHPTYFESVTAMAFLLFRDAAVDRVVLEVGLGGRLDATNVVAPELCVITPIDYDHEAYLGNTLELIAGEKAGILKPGVPAIFAPQRAAAAAVLERRAAELGIHAEHAALHPVEHLAIDARGSRFTAAGMEITCPLAGEHQVENALTAALALSSLGVSPDGIRNAVWPGRLERVREQPEILLDGAHNPAGARALAKYLRRFYSDRVIRLIYGAMRDKAIEEITGVLFPLAQEIFVTAPDAPRALRPEALAHLYPQARHAANLRHALHSLNAAPSDLVLITGSLFLVGEARALFVP